MGQIHQDFQELRKEIIILCSERILRHIKDNNITTFNGPYNDRETGLRWSCHAMILLECYSKETNLDVTEELFKLGNNISSLLSISEDLLFRLKGDKDSSNGVIGFAWVLECLYWFKNSHYFDTGLIDKLEARLHFNKQNKAWIFQEKNSWKNDHTFNHQLWLSCILLSSVKDELRNCAKDYILNVQWDRIVDKQGLIVHGSPSSGQVRTYKEKLRTLLKLDAIKDKTIGYHYFNIVALCHNGALELLSKDLQAQLIVLREPKLYLERVSLNVFGDYYNASSLELAIAYSKIGRYDNLSIEALRQFKDVVLTSNDALLNLKAYELALC